MVAIVLAAGYATRLYPLTQCVPKALLKIGSMTMLDHILDRIRDIEAITQIVIVSNKKFYGQFMDWVNERGADGNRAGIVVVNDGTESDETRLGAIGDISFTIDALSIDDEAMIIAGDNFYSDSLSGFYGFFKQTGVDCVIVKTETDAELLKRVGIAVVDSDYRVLDFEEKPKKPKSNLAVYAAYIYRRDTLPLFKAYLDEGNPKDSPGNFPAWLYSRKTVAAYALTGDCYDIGTPEAYSEICAKYAHW